MSHKYLKERGYKEKDLPWNWGRGDTRWDRWKQERKVYGFDERDTWSLNYTITLIVYERLKYYREYAPINMDDASLTHVYEVDGEELPYGAIIDRILKAFEAYLNTDDDIRFDEDKWKEYQKAWDLLGRIIGSLWW